MQEAFGIVLVAVMVVAALIAVASLAGSGKAYDKIGEGGFFGRDGGVPTPSSGADVPAAVRDDEIRQMLEARNARRVRRGEAELDIDAELERLNAPAMDPALEAEVRALVEARNRRRVRKGEAPLDVDAEIARTIRDLRE